MLKRITKLALIADLHLGPTVLYTGILPSQTSGDNVIMSNLAEQSLAILVDGINRDPSISCVVQLGDLIQDDVFSPSASADLATLNKARKHLEYIRSPLLHVIGNHDTVNIAPQEFMHQLGENAAYYLRVFDSWDAIVLYSCKNKIGRLEIGDQQIAWLQETLSRHSRSYPKREVLVFVHHSLADQNLSGNYWFDPVAETGLVALIDNRSRVREILESSKCVRAVFNGHMHWNNVTIHNGIPYISIRSPVDNVTLGGDCGDTPARTYAVAELFDDSLVVTYHGHDGKVFRFARNGEFTVSPSA